MSQPVYLEEDASEIYEKLSSVEEDYHEEDERSSDPMSDMISKYGGY